MSQKSKISKKAQAELEAALKLEKPWAYAWNEEEVIRVLQQMIDIAERDKKIVYVGDLLVKFGLRKEWPAHRSKQYETHEQISHMFSYLAQLLESRVLNGSINGMLKERTSLFVLNVHYGWKPQQAIEQTGSINVTGAEAANYTTEELLLLEQIREAAEKRKAAEQN